MKRVLVLMVALLVGAAASAGAQIATGNIYGTVVDQQGGVLPGVNVTVLADVSALALSIIRFAPLVSVMPPENPELFPCRV